MNYNWQDEHEDGEWQWEIDQTWLEREQQSIWDDYFADPNVGCDWDDSYV